MNINEIKIPEGNSLKSEIEEIVKLCVEKENESTSYFKEPVAEGDMEKWENENDIKIPETYKEWLRFSNGSQIDGSTATFLGVDRIVVNSKYIPEDLVIIGHLIGDGEVLCFSKETGKFVRFFEGRENGMFDNFNEVLKKIIRLVSGESSITDEKIQEMLLKVKEMRERGEL